MPKTNDGGSAFPRQESEHDAVSGGMSLRDYFAAAALTGFQVFVKGGWSGGMPDVMADDVAKNCYLLADAMLRARESELSRPKREGVSG